MNRRGGFSQPIIDAFALFVIVVIFLVFFLLFSISSNERQYKIKEHVASVDGNIALFTYLRTPVTYQGATIPVAEALQRIDGQGMLGDKAYYDVLREPTDQFLKDYHASTGCPIKIQITIGDNTNMLVFQDSSDAKAPCTEYNLWYEGTQLIPRHDGTMAKAELYAGKDLAKAGSVT